MVSAASWPVWAWLAVQRLMELSSARANERALRLAGGVEHSPGHYPLLVAFHAAFLAALGAAIARGARLDAEGSPWLAVFAAGQALRFFSIHALGPAWTTRIWTLPGRAPTRSGPYRLLRHPIYLAVFLEVLALPMAYGLARFALAAAALNAALLLVRIRAEERAWASP